MVAKDGSKSRGSEFLQWAIDDSHPAAYDMDARVEVMDEVGIYAQILYPNVAGFGSQKFVDVKDPEVKRLAATVYNDAMAEIQDHSSGRLYPMALMPWWDIDASVAEARRARLRSGSAAWSRAPTRRTAACPTSASASGTRSGRPAPSSACP